MAIKVGTAYVEVAGDFKPLNRQLSQLDRVSTRIGADIRRSLRQMSSEANAARRPVARLTSEVAKTGAASRASTREAVAGLRQMEAAYERNLRAVRRLHAAQMALGRSQRARAGMPIGGVPYVVGRGSGGSGGSSFNLLGTAGSVGLDAALGAAFSKAGTFRTNWGIGRSLGMGGKEAARNAVTMMSRAGEFGAKAMFKGFARAIPAAGAAVSVGGVLEAGLEGDMEKAGRRAGGLAGGAIIGGVAGALSGGTLAVPGALLGAAVGETLVEGAESIFGGGESGNDKAAMLGVEFAERFGKGLEKASRGKKLGKLETYRRNLRYRLVEAKDAGADDESLAPMRKVVRGVESQITQLRIPRAAVLKQMGLLKSGLVTRLKDINRIFQVNARSIDRGWDKGSKEWRKTSANNMRAAVGAIKAGMNQGVISTSSGSRRIKQLMNNIRLTEGRDPFRIAKGFKDSWKQAGEINNAQIARMVRDLKKMPKGAREKAQDTMIQMARALKSGGKLSEKSFSALRSGLLTNFGKTKSQLAREALRMASKVAGTFGNLAGSVGISLENIGSNVNSIMSAFKVSSPLKFAVHAVKNILGVFSKNQKGGFIVPGKGDGDSYRTIVSAGSFVLNKRATKQLGFQQGGPVPVALEPGERVFSPHEVRRVGLGNLEAANRAVPRFQRGGGVREPQLSGREPLRTVGQRAIGNATDAAREYVREHRPKGGLGNAPPALRKAMALAQEMGLQITSTTGGEHTATSWHYKGRAFDASNGVVTPEMRRYALAAARRWGHNILELFYDPLGWYIKNGQKISGSIGGHSDHVHTAMQMGGLIRKFSTGGFVGDINRIYPEHNSADGDWGGETLPSYVVAALAEAAGQALGVGVPGRTMEQVTRGESGAHKRNSARPGATGIDPGGTKGLGLWMITTGFNDALIAKYGGQGAMRNPVRNAAAMAEIYGSQGLGAWYGTGSVTGGSLHYDGRYDLSNALGGRTFSQTLGIAPRGDAKGGVGADRKAEYEAKLAAVAGEVGRADSLPVKQSKLWKLIRLWGRLGVFDQGEKTHILQAVQAAASAADAGESVKILRDLARFTESHGEVTGKPAEGSKPLIDAISQAQTKGREKRKKRVEKQRKQVQSLRKKVADKIRERASFADLVATIADLRRKADDQETYIGEVVALEPEDMTKAYVELEESAYKDELTKLLGWRNSVVGAQGYAAAEIERFRQQIAEIEALRVHENDPLAAPAQGKGKGKGKKGKGKMLGGIVEYLSKGGKPGVGKGHPAPGGPQRGLGQARNAEAPGPNAYGKQKFRIPLLEQAIRDAEGLINETWREELEEISPNSMTGILGEIPPDPVAGAFGGRVFEVQTALRSLGLKGGSGDNSSEEAALLRELLVQAEQRNVVRGIEENVFASMPKVGSGFQSGGLVGVMPPYGGKAHVGAVVPGPPGQERTMVVKSGEGIFTPEQMAALGGGGELGPVRVNVNGDIVSSHPDPVEVLLGDRRLTAEIRKVTGRDNRRQARGAGRGLATPGVFSR